MRSEVSEELEIQNRGGLTEYFLDICLEKAILAGFPLRIVDEGHFIRFDYFDS